jgi:hypothetical protein
MSTGRHARIRRRVHRIFDPQRLVLAANPRTAEGDLHPIILTTQEADVISELPSLVPAGLHIREPS